MDRDQDCRNLESLVLDQTATAIHPTHPRVALGAMLVREAEELVCDKLRANKRQP